MVKYHAPVPTNASKASVSKFAEEAAKELSFSQGDPLDVVISRLGGSVSFRNPVGESHPESIRVEPDGRFTIYLPTVTSQERDRFTLAHELGHLFLHFPRIKADHPKDGMRATRWVDDANATQQRCEWEANWFAASFLMPAGPFKDAVRRIGLPAAATKFAVSDKAAEVRARSLGL